MQQSKKQRVDKNPRSRGERCQQGRESSASRANARTNSDELAAGDQSHVDRRTGRSTLDWSPRALPLSRSSCHRLSLPASSPASPSASHSASPFATTKTRGRATPATAPAYFDSPNHLRPRASFVRRPSPFTRVLVRFSPFQTACTPALSTHTASTRTSMPIGRPRLPPADQPLRSRPRVPHRHDTFKCRGPPACNPSSP